MTESFTNKITCEDFWNRLRKGTVLQFDASGSDLVYLHGAACIGNCFGRRECIDNCKDFTFNEKNLSMNLLVVDKEKIEFSDDTELHILCLTPEQGFCNIYLTPGTFSFLEVLIP